MNTFIIISIIIFLLAFIVLVVYSILTLIQIKNTAKQAEEVLRKINKNLENVTDISNKITSGVNAVVPFIASITAVAVSGLTRVLKSLFFRGGK
ncbi:MAG: DUF948 domain-containing protein [Elusimicrobiota bacterium]|nr:DUF948 domain-containing protein [Elusimicrobiota bacterium]